MQQNTFGFSDKCIWISSGKFSLTARILVVGSRRVKTCESSAKKQEVSLLTNINSVDGKIPAVNIGAMWL